MSSGEKIAVAVTLALASALSVAQNNAVSADAAAKSDKPAEMLSQPEPTADYVIGPDDMLHI